MAQGARKKLSFDIFVVTIEEDQGKLTQLRTQVSNPVENAVNMLTILGLK